MVVWWQQKWHLLWLLQGNFFKRSCEFFLKNDFTFMVARKRAICFYLQHPAGFNRLKGQVFVSSGNYYIPSKRDTLR